MPSGLSNGSGLAATSASLILKARYSGLTYAGGPPPTPLSQWVSAVVANGGTVSPARQAIVQTFIDAEVTAGTWDRTEDYWALWAENAPQALTSLKRRVLAEAVLAPVFTVDRGYTFNGSTNYVDTKYRASTDALISTAVDLRLGAYERADVNGAGASATIGSSNSVPALQTNYYVRPRQTDTCNVGLMASSANCGASLNSLGFFAGFRNGSTLVTHWGMYRNGALLGNLSGLPGVINTTGMPNTTLFIGGINNAGSLSSARATSIGFGVASAAYTPAQELAQYNNIQAWATAIGAQV